MKLRSEQKQTAIKLVAGLVIIFASGVSGFTSEGDGGEGSEGDEASVRSAPFALMGILTPLRY